MIRNETEQKKCKSHHDFNSFFFLFVLSSENYVRLQIFFEDLSLAKTINEESYKVTAKITGSLIMLSVDGTDESSGPTYSKPLFIFGGFTLSQLRRIERHEYISVLYLETAIM